MFKYNRYNLKYTHVHTHTQTHTYLYVYMCDWEVGPTASKVVIRFWFIEKFWCWSSALHFADQLGHLKAGLQQDRIANGCQSALRFFLFLVMTINGTKQKLKFRDQFLWYAF